MTSRLRQGELEGRFLGLVRGAVLTLVLVGAAGSLGLMFRAGHRQKSWILVLLFAIWVLAPFMALVAAHVLSTNWSVLTRATLYSFMLVVTLFSLAIYGEVAFRLPTAKVGFVFLAVPSASWLLIVIVLPVAALVSRRLSSGRDGG